MFAAARHDDVPALAALLAGGAHVDERDLRGNTPLMLAAYTGAHAAAAYLLRRGANPNACDRAGNTILMSAAAGGSATMVRRLLAYGADPHQQNAAHLGARDLATHFGHDAVVALLAA